jgi:hypothetical protein
MPKFTLLPPVAPIEEQPISASLEVEEDGAVLLILQRGEDKAEVLRVTSCGRVARIIGFRKELRALGLKVTDYGTVQLIN